jgi:ATP/maltotriose-dependent transcriptional regulator MalT
MISTSGGVFLSTRLAATGGQDDPGSFKAALEVGESSGSLHPLAYALASLSVAHTLSGEWDRAIEACDRSLTIMREKGVARDVEANALTTLARAHLGRGDVMRAQALVGEAAALARSQGAAVFLCAANLVRAEALVARDGARAAGEVEAILAEAEQLVAQTGARIYLPDVHLARAELARLAGDEAARHRELSEAHRLFTEMGATVRAEQVAKALVT